MKMGKKMILKNLLWKEGSRATIVIVANRMSVYFSTEFYGTLAFSDQQVLPVQKA